MAIFFLVVGLEVKREFVAGELRALGRALLPVLARSSTKIHRSAESIPKAGHLFDTRRTIRQISK
jgi:hypothetical protein